MRTIRELVEREKTVWIYLDNETIGREFMRQAAAEGFHYDSGLGPVPAWWNYAMAIHSDLTLGCVPMFIWVMSYSVRMEGVPRRIDYEKYRAGEEDILCRSSHFTGSMRMGSHGE